MSLRKHIHTSLGPHFLSQRMFCPALGNYRHKPSNCESNGLNDIFITRKQCIFYLLSNFAAWNSLYVVRTDICRQIFPNCASTRLFVRVILKVLIRKWNPSVVTNSRQVIIQSTHNRNILKIEMKQSQRFQWPTNPGLWIAARFLIHSANPQSRPVVIIIFA